MPTLGSVYYSGSGRLLQFNYILCVRSCIDQTGLDQSTASWGCGGGGARPHASHTTRRLPSAPEAARTRSARGRLHTSVCARAARTSCLSAHAICQQTFPYRKPISDSFMSLFEILRDFYIVCELCEEPGWLSVLTKWKNCVIFFLDRVRRSRCAGSADVCEWLFRCIYLHGK